MNDDRPPGPDPDDPGPPLPELRELRLEPDALFHQRIRASIHRRLFVSDAVDFTGRVLLTTLFDYLDLLVRTLGGRNGPPSAKE